MSYQSAMLDSYHMHSFKHPWAKSVLNCKNVQHILDATVSVALAADEHAVCNYENADKQH